MNVRILGQKTINITEMLDLKENRIGNFTISSDILAKCNYDTINLIFNNILVINSFYNIQANMINYTAISPYFEKIGGTAIPPAYMCRLIINEEDKKIIRVTWDKLDNRINEQQNSKTYQ